MDQASAGALQRRERIAILGGGMASLTTAFDLTSLISRQRLAGLVVHRGLPTVARAGRNIG